MAVMRELPALLLVLWREQHPKGHEQAALNFSSAGFAAEKVPLFES